MPLWRHAGEGRAVSNDIMPCGCEGHADNSDLCRYPKLEAENTRLKTALKESVKLQSHYAALLNGYDGGKRSTFTVESWLKRLEEIKAIPPVES